MVLDSFDVLRLVLCPAWFGYCGICLGGAVGFMYAKRHADPTYRVPRDKGNTMEALYGERHLSKWMRLGAWTGLALGVIWGIPFAALADDWCGSAAAASGDAAVAAGGAAAAVSSTGSGAGSSLLAAVLGGIAGAISFPALALPNPFSTVVEPAFRLMQTPTGKCAEEYNDLIYGERVFRETPYWGSVVGILIALCSKYACSFLW